MLSTHNDRLPSCPASPNCVCSDATDKKHYIEPYQLKVKSSKGLEVLKEVISSLPRTTIISATNTYLYAQARSRIFGFIHDMEFQLRPRQNIIAVRSATRLGYYDFGVNRWRIGEIGKELQARGIIQ
ncbi:MAG: DUF1499 domain-containing protein [Candidatus Nitrosoglobus sp.]